MLNVKRIENLPCIKIGEGRSGCVYKISDRTVKKVYFNDTKPPAEYRMSKEIKVLETLKEFDNFPKIKAIDEEKKVLYMSYVGVPIKEIKKSELPKNIIEQVTNIINCLKISKIFHHDLSINHLMILKNKIYLIDFEKACIDKCHNQLDENKTYKYKDMSYLLEIVKKYLKII